MIVYSICNTAYENDISGNGAKLFGGRWNSKGIPMLYTSQNISLTILEMLVNNQFKDFSVPLSLLTILLPDNSNENDIKLKKLKKDWAADISYTKFIGNEFVKSKSNLYLQVPSAVIQEEYNFLINPLHKDFKKIKIMAVKSFRTDRRLFSI